jgi:ribosomal protein S27E
MDSDDDKVTQLPVKFHQPPDENRTLLKLWEVGKPLGCFHDSFVVDETKDTVECAKCGEKLNPMWVLNYLAGRDRNMADNWKRSREAMNLLHERSRTKCQHCGQMTRIRGF